MTVIPPLKVKFGIGGHAYPNDFNWTCPTCNRENRSFQLPPLEFKEGWTLEQLENACLYCSHEKKWDGYPAGFAGEGTNASTGQEWLERHAKR